MYSGPILQGDEGIRPREERAGRRRTIDTRCCSFLMNTHSSGICCLPNRACPSLQWGPLAFCVDLPSTCPSLGGLVRALGAASTSAQGCWAGQWDSWSGELTTADCTAPRPDSPSHMSMSLTLPLWSGARGSPWRSWPSRLLEERNVPPGDSDDQVPCCRGSWSSVSNTGTCPGDAEKPPLAFPQPHFTLQPAHLGGCRRIRTHATRRASIARQPRRGISLAFLMKNTALNMPLSGCTQRIFPKK